MDEKKQIEEMVNVPTKEEQIAQSKRAKELEELKKALYNYANKELTHGIKNLVDCECCASYLFEIENYRKIPEGAVVLTREEFENFGKECKNCPYALEWYKETLRKETARDIVKKGNEYLMQSTDKACAFACFLGIIEHDYGVEVEE